MAIVIFPYGPHEPSLLIESTDSMISICMFVHDLVLRVNGHTQTTCGHM